MLNLDQQLSNLISYQNLKENKDMKLKAATLVFTASGDPLIVCDDLINIGDSVYSTETKDVSQYNDENRDKINLRKLLASTNQIGYMVAHGMIHEVQIPIITEMLVGQISLETTDNDELKLFNNKVIIHHR